MSKGLEALKELLEYVNFENRHDSKSEKAVSNFDIIEKELKALEIIKNKKVAYLFMWLIEKHNKKCALRLYNEPCEEDRKITEEEYDLLKEVLL